MALRIRKDGEILCAAINKALAGDCYLDDDIHYYLSAIKKVLITTENKHHVKNGGEWWWKGQEPKDVIIAPFYLEKN